MTMSKNDQKADLKLLRKKLTEELKTEPDKAVRKILLGELLKDIWHESTFSYYPLRFRLKYYRLHFIVYDHLRRRRQMTRRESPMDPEEVGPVMDLLSDMIGKKQRNNLVFFSENN